jgi:hypothetical protein
MSITRGAFQNCSLIVVCFLIAGLFGAGAASAETTEQSLAVETPLEFTIPNPSGAGTSLSFLLYSNRGTVSDVTLVTRQINDPLGQVLNRKSLLIPSSIGAVSVGGTSVEFRPDPSFFSRPGKYSITLMASGKGADGHMVKPLVINLVITRSSAEINLGEISNQTVALTRSWPLGEAAGEALLTLEETSGNADISHLMIGTHQLFANGTKTQITAAISASLVPLQSTKGEVVPPLGSRKIRLRFSGIPYAGDYTTELTLASFTLGGIKTIPLKVTVSDSWLWALIAITLGVLGGYLTHFLSENWRPRRLNAYNIVRLRAAVDQYLLSTTDPQKVRKLLEIERLIFIARRINDHGQPADSKSQLDRAQQLLDDFAQAAVAQVEAARLTEPHIEVRDAPRDRTTDTQIRFRVVGLSPALATEDTVRWYFGDGSAPETRSGEATSHRFPEPDDYDIVAEVLRGKGQTIDPQLAQRVTIAPGRTAVQLKSLWRQIQAADVALSGIALALACLLGLEYLYVGKTFGSLTDYITAILWGFGLDNGVRGFSAVLAKITTT